MGDITKSRVTLGLYESFCRCSFSRGCHLVVVIRSGRGICALNRTRKGRARWLPPNRRWLVRTIVGCVATMLLSNPRDTAHVPSKHCAPHNFPVARMKWGLCRFGLNANFWQAFTGGRNRDSLFGGTFPTGRYNTQQERYS